MKTADNKPASIVCFGGEDWWYHNRGHIDMQLMRRFARRATVLYVNSIVMQKPRIAEGRKLLMKVSRKLKSIFTGVKKTDAGFWAYSPFSIPVHHIGWAMKLNEMALRRQIKSVSLKLGIEMPLVWVACPVACRTAVKMKKSKLVYQRTDRYEEFPNVEHKVVSEYDRILKREADLTVFVNRRLYEEEKSQCRNSMYLDHGVDYEMFASADKDENIPSEMRGLQMPIVGFFGGIDDHTFDVPFMGEVIRLMPEMTFVFVGKASADCSCFATQPNVLMLGQKPYEQIPHYGKCFDAAVMPWRQNRWIEVCNPVKMKEYLALGKPVISRPFAELDGYKDVIYCAETATDFAEAIRKAVPEDNAGLVAARRKKVERCTWDGKAEEVWEKLFDSEVSPEAMV